jgi:hypothetical protein
MTAAIGMVTFILFPFALPCLGLIIVAGLLLALPLLALVAVAAILTGTWLGIRAAGRRLRRLRRPALPETRRLAT